MAITIKLPARKGSIQYSDETVRDWYDTLMDLAAGEAVVVDDVQDSSTKATDRAKKAQALLAKEPHDLKVKAHSIETDEGFVPAVSIPIGARN